MDFISIHANTRLHYEFHQAEERGPNTATIVLIHGVGFDMTSWDSILPYFNKHYHVLRYDLRGHGQSEKGDVRITKRVLIEDASYLIDTLNLKQIHLIGHGAGSIIAALFDLYVPDKVLTVTLLSLPMFLSTSMAEKFAAYRRELTRKGSTVALASHLIGSVTLRDRTDEGVQKLYTAFNKVEIETYFEMWDGFVEAHAHIFDLLKLNQRPMLIMTGDLDPLYPPHISGLHTSYIPNSRYATVFNSSNMVFLDQPKQTYENIRQFIENLSSNQPKHASGPYIALLYSELNQMIEEQQKSHLAASTLCVSLLNRFEVSVNGEPITEGWNQRHAKELLVYLVLHPSVTRNQLCSDLWPDVELKKARHHLRVYLTYLRKIIKDEHHHFLQLGKNHIILKGIIQCDLSVLIQEVEQALQETDPAAKQLMGQNILSMVPLTSQIVSHMKEDWFTRIKLRLLNQLTRLFRNLADLSEKSNCLDEGKRYIEALNIWGHPENL